MPGDEGSGAAKVVPKKPAKSGTIKLKKAPPKHHKPGNWRDGSVVDDDKTKKPPPPTTAASPGPVVNQLDDSARDSFATGRPLEDNPDLQQCKHCKKSVLRTAAKGHIAQCLRLKKEKAQRKKEAREARERAKEAAREEEARKNDPDGDDKDGDSDGDDISADKKGKAGKKAAGKKPDVGGKKRKADGELEKGPKSKKKKDEPKAKAPKTKGPVDVERQCGVILPNGQPCARSLTCKSHSMGAKRAVPGRSLPYDMLLAAYQKKNQAKQQKAALDANAPLEDDDDLTSAQIDSDEETAAVMSSLARWRPVALIPQPVFEPLRRKMFLARLDEQLDIATNGGRINIFKPPAQIHPSMNSGGYFNNATTTTTQSHQPVPDGEDAPGEPELNISTFAPAANRTSNTPIPRPIIPARG